MDGTLFDLPKPVTDADERAFWHETAVMMRAWRQEKEQLEAIIARANTRLTVVNRKLEHAAGMIEEEVSAPLNKESSVETEEESDDAASHAAVIGQAMDDALTRAPSRGLRCAALRAEVMKNSAAHERFKDHPNRFYSVLNRRVGKGKIVKRGKFYRLPDLASPQGETGAVAAPVSL